MNADKKYFFADVEDLRTVIPVTTAFNYGNFEPYLRKAAVLYFRNDLGIGKQLFDEILNAYNTGYDQLSAIKKQLVQLIRIPIANLAMANYAAIASITIGVDGMTTEVKDGKAGVKKWQQDELKAQFFNDGYEAIELLLEWLEENKDSFSTWTGSSAYTIFKEQFISTVAEFQQSYTLLRSRRTFLAIRHIMTRTDELQIKKILPTDKYTEIKTQLKAGNLSDGNKAIVNLIRPALSHLTMAKAFDELSITINENGVQVFASGTNTDNQVKSDPASEVKIQRLKESAVATGESYLNDLRKMFESDFTGPTGDRGNDPDSKIYFV